MPSIDVDFWVAFLRHLHHLSYECMLIDLIFLLHWIYLLVESPVDDSNSTAILHTPWINVWSERQFDILGQYVDIYGLSAACFSMLTSHYFFLRQVVIRPAGDFGQIVERHWLLLYQILRDARQLWLDRVLMMVTCAWLLCWGVLFDDLLLKVFLLLLLLGCRRLVAVMLAVEQIAWIEFNLIFSGRCMLLMIIHYDYVVLIGLDFSLRCFLRSVACFCLDQHVVLLFKAVFIDIHGRLSCV